MKQTNDAVIAATTDHTIDYNIDQDNACRPRLSPELALLLSIARLTLTDAQCAQIDASAETPLDWARLIKLGRWHGLLPLLAHHLSDDRLGSLRTRIPSETMVAIRQARLINGLHCMQLGAELKRLAELLAEHDIPVIPYKGIMLARQLYRDDTLRQSGDIDIIVPKAQTTAAKAYLEEEGYQPVVHFTSSAQEQAYTNQMFEYEFHHPKKRIRLELHWDIIQPHHAVAIDWPEIWSRSTPGLMRRMAPEDQLIILCIHGVKHYWAGLKWIMDVKLLIDATPQMNWEAALTRAHNWKVRRIVLFGLLVVDQLLTASYPESIRAAMAKDSSLPGLMDDVLAMQEDPVNLEEHTAELIAFNMRLRERPLDRLAFAARILGNLNYQDVDAEHHSIWRHYRRRVERLIGKHGWSRVMQMLSRIGRAT